MSSSRTRLPWFDLIRAASALGVAASHLRVICLPSYGELTSPGPLTKLFYLATGLGHQCVVIFFVMSGFFVGGSILGKGAKFTFRDYFAARISRLWMVLLPALLLTLGLDLVSQQLFPTIFDGHLRANWSSGPEAGAYSISPLTFLGNLAFLQTGLVPVFGSNGPLWSLFNEWWYYVIFPLVTCAFGWTGNHSSWMRVALGLAAATLLILLPSAILPGFAVWLGGVALWKTPMLKWSGWTALLATAASGSALAFGLVASKAGTLDKLGPLHDLALGLVVFAFLWACLHLPEVAKCLAGLFEKLSECSYSLYLSHFPITMLIGAVAYQSRSAYSIASAGTFLALLVLLQAAGFGFYWLFERHTPRARAMLSGKNHTKRTAAYNTEPQLVTKD